MPRKSITTGSLSRIRASFSTTDLTAAALGVTEEIDASVTRTAASAPTCGKQSGAAPGQPGNRP
ncbi:hypothetical protein ND991_03405 [Gordonia sputi]|uniref:hypothetical protein n=1 Tax=Gordonia sputi TaxID=36823 RepID=UPI0020444F2D|nr:hypothetical protein [Gordonia sputi]MCM3894269.1 hypothetical protein [Gordonia sputi]